MTILHTEYDEEAARRVYAEEMVEDVMMDLAMQMLQDGEVIERIARYSKLPLETIRQLRDR